MHEVDEHEIDFLLDQLIVRAITERGGQTKFIDDVL